MTQVQIPSQFTGYVAADQQDPENFNLVKQSWTPKAFEEDDLIIKVECCGICGSDLHTITNGWKSCKYPACVGHEIVGTVVRAGSKTNHTVGSRVGFGAQSGSCGECEYCNNKQEQFCVKGSKGTYQGATGDETQPYNQGGYADYFTGKGRFAVRIPEGLESTNAAPMLCAGVTCYSPLKYYGAGPGKRVGIVGIGGLGHLGLQFAKALGAETYAISHSDSKREAVQKLGADGFIATKDAKATVEQYKGFFDILLCTSFQENMPIDSLYLPLLKPRGHMVLVGLSDAGIPAFMPWPLLGRSLTGSFIGSPSDIEEMFEVAVKHNVKTWVETRPMAEASQAVQDMHHGKARFRYVLTN